MCFFNCPPSVMKLRFVLVVTLATSKCHEQDLQPFSANSFKTHMYVLAGKVRIPAGVDICSCLVAACQNFVHMTWNQSIFE